MKARLLIVAAGALCCAAACQLLADFTPPDAIDRPLPDSGPLPDNYVPPPPPDPCVHDVPAAMPTSDPDPVTALAPAWLAMHTFSLNHLDSTYDGGTNDAAVTTIFGYDLDGVCTCDTAPHTAHDGGPSCITPEGVPPTVVQGAFCDQAGGIDNALGTLGKAYNGEIDIDNVANIQNEINFGAETMLLELTEYNGLGDDLSVQLGAAFAPGIRSLVTDINAHGCDGGSRTEEAGPQGTYAPFWDGCDVWTGATQSITVSGGVPAPLAAAAGYVSNYQLVVPISTEVTFPFAQGTLQLASTTFTATIVPLDASLTPITDKSRATYVRLVNGVVTARVSGQQILGLLETYVVPGMGNQRICDNSFYLQQVIDNVCTDLDSRFNPTSDFFVVPDSGQEVPCDAFSVAFSFTADLVGQPVDLFEAGTLGGGCDGAVPPLNCN